MPLLTAIAIAAVAYTAGDVPIIVRRQAGDRRAACFPRAGLGWQAGVVATMLFVGIFGPGISFQR